ncbi:MAG: hypothetical protein Q9165_008503 [Trypethelium subeluteriae]
MPFNKTLQLRHRRLQMSFGPRLRLLRLLLLKQLNQYKAHEQFRTWALVTPWQVILVVAIRCMIAPASKVPQVSSTGSESIGGSGFSHSTGSDVLGDFPFTSPSTAVLPPTRSNPYSAPAAEPNNAHEQSIGSDLSGSSDPVGIAYHVSANAATGKSSSVPSQDGYDIELGDNTYFQGNHFTSAAVSNLEETAGRSTDTVPSKAGGRQGLVQSTNAESAADNIVAAIGKGDRTTAEDLYQSNDGPDGADYTTRHHILAENNGFGEARTDFHYLQTADTGDRNLPEKTDHRQGEGDYGSDAIEQVSSVKFLVTSGQHNPGGSPITKIRTGPEGYGHGTQPESHDPDTKGLSEGYALVGGQSIVKDPVMTEDLLIGNQHLQKGQATNIAGTPIVVGPSGVVIGRIFTLPFDSISVRGSVIAISTNAPAAQTPYDSSGVPITNEFNPIATI